MAVVLWLRSQASRQAIPGLSPQFPVSEDAGGAVFVADFPMPAGTRCAGRVGYDTPSAFVAAFRRETGQTPGSYFRP